MKEEAIENLKKYNQEHILNYLPYLTQKEQQDLEEQILKIDFEQLKQLSKITSEKTDEKIIEHIPYTDKSKLPEKRKKELEAIGKREITSGTYAVITMAGGQGTRLGHSGPKGTYRLNTVNGPKYIFEIIVDKLKQAQKEYGVTIPWYIMTSNENHNDTVKFLEEQQYFGYDSSKVKFFIQGELPLLDTKGKLILNKDKKIKEAADGNGGIYEAVYKSGLLEKMKKSNINWIFISNVDNILSNFIDPILLGLMIEEKQKIAVQSVAKNYPKEKAGVLCKMNGKPKVIEYIDLPDEMAEERDSNGELLYGEMNIGNYIFHRSVFENIADTKLPFHIALKKSGYLNENGEYIEPDEPNVHKFEAFIFDAFTRFDGITILRVNRQEEFAPVKSKEGNDSPETAIALYNAKYKQS